MLKDVVSSHLYYNVFISIRKTELPYSLICVDVGFMSSHAHCMIRSMFSVFSSDLLLQIFYCNVNLLWKDELILMALISFSERIGLKYQLESFALKFISHRLLHQHVEVALKNVF